MKFGYLRQDPDCHWYVVPEDQIEEFDLLLEKIEGKEYLEAEDDFAEFDQKFGELRRDGGVSSYKVLMELPETELNLDISAEEARALHRVVRAMHDGHCPSCGTLSPSEEKVSGNGYRCESCGFAVSGFVAQAALQEFRPFLQRSLTVFEEWREKRGYRE